MKFQCICRPLKLSYLSIPLFVFCLSLLLSGCNAPKGNSEFGQRWYSMHNCFACHGKHGNDGKAPNIAGLDMGYWSFKRRLRNSETAIMPAYPEEKISSQDVADILAWLKTLP